MSFQRRQYQVDAVNKAVESLMSTGTSLWQMPTGSGKAYCIAMLIKEMSSKTGRILVLVDQTNLVEQLYSTISTQCSPIQVGIACRGVSKIVSNCSKVVVASRQTLCSMPDVLQSGFDFVILDEAHEVKPMRVEKGKIVGDGQYYDIIDTIINSTPNKVRIHGCTATPWRLNDGYIYGKDRSKYGNVNYFDDLTYRVSYKEMISGGFIVSPVFHRDANYVDRKSLKIDIKTGEFDERSVSKIMSSKIGESVWLYRDVLSGVKYNAAFCCDIAHCEMLCDELNSKGFKAYAMHSKMKESRLEEWKRDGGCLVTVDQATKGFDFPPLTGLLLLRPTNSPAICYQQIGRSLRASSSKKEAIIVDPCGNTAEHLRGNDLDRPVVTWSRRVCMGDEKEKPLTFRRLLSKKQNADVETKEAEKEMAIHRHADGGKYITIMAENISYYSTIGGKGHWLMIRAKSGVRTIYRVELHFLDGAGTAAQIAETREMLEVLGVAGCTPYDVKSLMPINLYGAKVVLYSIGMKNKIVSIDKVVQDEDLRD